MDEENKNLEEYEPVDVFPAEVVSVDDFPIKEVPARPPQVEQDNSQPGKIAFIISLCIFGLLFLYAFVQQHLQASSKVALGLLGLGCVYLVIRYFRQIKNAAIIARRGNALLAKKTALEAFIPMLGSINLMAYNFINSEAVQKYLGIAKDSGTMVKGWLTSLSPDKGIYIYYGAIILLVFLFNGIIIKNFKRALRVAKILTR